MPNIYRIKEIEMAENNVKANEAEIMENITENSEVQERKVSSKRLKKIERREAKAARKAANQVEEKKSRPNNGLIALLIFGVVIAMFVFVLGYNYFSKPATIEKYLEDNGGEDTYGSMLIDAYTTAAITAEGNSMNIAMTVDTEDEDAVSMLKEYYEGDDGEDQLKYITAYFLTSMKPETRAFSADAKSSITIGDDEIASVEMTYKEAKEYLEEAQEEAEEDAEDADAEEAEEADDAADAAEDTAEDGE